MIDRGRRLLVAAVGVLVFAAAAAAGPLQDDLTARRARLIERLGPSALAIFWSAEPKVYSLDTDYEFRQDSDMLYLTGIAQEGAILVLMPGNRTQKEVLFIREPNPRREHWNGHSLTKEEATAESGIKKVHYAGEFESFVTAMFNRRPHGVRRGEVTDEFDTFFDAVGANRATLALPLGPRPAPSAPLTPVYEFAAKARDRFVNVTFVDTLPMVAELRQIKTPYEQTLMEKSAIISGKAHMAGMSTAAPGRFEYRGRSRHRTGLHGQRRHALGLSLDRRQRPQRHDPPLQRIEPADAGRRSAPRRRGGQLPGLHRRHHPHVSGERDVHRGAEGSLPARAGGAGSGHAGGEDRREDVRRREGGGSRRQARAAEARTDHGRGRRPVPHAGTRTASATGSAWTCTTWATTRSRSRRG